MTRKELAAFWDEQLRLWLRNEPLSPRLDEWRRAYRGEVDEWAFPEPYIGDLLGSPRIVLLANNPGEAHEELQAAGAVFPVLIAEVGFTAWAATRPYEGPDSPWVRLRSREIPHNWDRIRFARRFLCDASLPRQAVLNIELFPWHSPRLDGGIRVDPGTLREFVLEPLSEFQSDVPVVALGSAWRDALDRASGLVVDCDEFRAFSAPTRRARRYTTIHGRRILVVWHSGSDKPPNPDDTALLRRIWLGEAATGQLASVEAPHAPARGREGRKPAIRHLRAEVPARRRESRLVATLHSWIETEFDGMARLGTNTPGRVRLHVSGGGATIGWNIRADFIAVWVKTLDDQERTLLDTLSEPDAVQTNKADTSFRVHNDADLAILQEVVRRRVLVTR